LSLTTISTWLLISNLTLTMSHTSHFPTVKLCHDLFHYQLVFCTYCSDFYFHVQMKHYSLLCMPWLHVKKYKSLASLLQMAWLSFSLGQKSSKSKLNCGDGVGTWKNICNANLWG
jgi:hypothetical protein